MFLTCIRLGLMASFMRTVRAPATPKSSAVTGSPALQLEKLNLKEDSF